MSNKPTRSGVPRYVIGRRPFLEMSAAASIGCLAVKIDAVPGEALMIKNSLLIDGTNGVALEGASILIEAGRFTKIVQGHLKAPASARIIDASGKTVVPGLIDMHAHLISGGFDTISDKSMSFDPSDQKRILKQMLYWGVTSVCNPVQPLDSGLELRALVATKGYPSPRLFISGPAITAPGGWGGANQPEARIELSEVGQVEQQVDRLARAKVDFLKLFYDDMSSSFSNPLPKLDGQLMAAVIRAAHARGLKVMVHAYRTEDHKDAMRAGADIMAHSAITQPVDAEYLDLARKNRTMYLSTLSVYHDVFDEVAIRELISKNFVQRTVPKKTLATLTGMEPLNS
ncbi:MAG: amidohydrolase family protein, partial [Pyrinomonadaceae bacterium]